MPCTIEQLKQPKNLEKAKECNDSIKFELGSHRISFSNIPFVAYLCYKLLISGETHLDSALSTYETAKLQFERFKSGEIALDSHIRKCLDENVYYSFYWAYHVYEKVGNDPAVFAAIVMLFDDYYDEGDDQFSTPDSLIKLSQAILDIQDSDQVTDICCGNGNFLTKSFERQPNASYTGYDINIHCAARLAMKADILGFKPNIIMGDIEQTLSDKPVKYDKIFSNYPLGVHLNDYDQIAPSLPFRINRTSSDWYFNHLIVNHLSENGKAIAIASIGSTWNATNQAARKYFIENGFVEAVINLPSSLFSNTTIPTTIYVFSHHNERIRLVNAEEFFTITKTYPDTPKTGVSYVFKPGSTKREPLKYLSDNNIEQILDFIGRDTEYSVSISKVTAAEHDYSLAFRTYKPSLPTYKNGVALSEVAEIIRGINAPHKNISIENTGKYLLHLSDLENGFIKEELTEDVFIQPDKIYSEQRLHPYDIVISRSAQPIKIAVVDPNEQRELYPTGNMFIIRPKSTKINPYYLLAFLLSRDGQEALGFASTGSILKTISFSSLSNLIFPLAKAEHQREIACEITENISEYKVYLHKAGQAKNKIGNSYYC